ncbi:LlaJI family restriction endonuclease [Xylophilus sp. GOD-11R]|uniref:LlaJI family restriction endonuclease n=1 Tax=Xylophilus sp. GOD-11R TaxID=3089814 RepID=UPI00298BD15D|nr:LlaJI family restriction endonuclease [Xylophilus sp. GOD-11R]WPB57365.1 LlaJI family restriction endonuclease [Xylophilus sp. GOD-11R]
MTVICVPEGTALSASAWCSQLGIGRDDLDLMLTAGLLRAQRGGLLAIEFVGMVIFTDSCLHVRPKYSTAENFDLAAMIAILRGYFSRSEKRAPFVDELRFPEFSDAEVLREFDALIALREWFAVHGFYRQKVERRSTGGRPNWALTMARQSPLVVGGSVLYPTIESERQHDAFNDITALQIGLMSALSRRYGLPISDELRTAALAAGPSIDVWPLPTATQQYLQKRVLAEKRVQFRSDNLRLLTLLEQILGSRLASRNRKIEVYGTTAFYSVWEDGCRVLFGGMAKPAEAIGHPTWTYIGENGAILEQERQLPDIVIASGDKLFILDAKYYFPFVKSKPGAPDIVKQLYYAEAVVASTWSAIRSLFILPMNDAWSLQRLGDATIEGSARNFPIVEAWGIEPKVVFASYPNAPEASETTGRRLLDAVEISPAARTRMS